jgi:hypothetical protein
MPFLRSLATFIILGLLAGCGLPAASSDPTPRSDQSKYGP